MHHQSKTYQSERGKCVATFRQAPGATTAISSFSGYTRPKTVGDAPTCAYAPDWRRGGMER